MQYEIQYDIVSIIAACFLIVLYILRRTYRTKSNGILLHLLVFDLLGGIFDVASCYAITYPQRYPLWMNCIMTLGYLFFYNMMGVLYFAYIDSKTKIAKMWKPAKVIIALCASFEALIIWSSPWTHLVSYFDDDLVYHHGPFMLLLYVFAALNLFMATVMFVIKRRRFNKYQVVAICSFICAVFMGVLIQAIFPNLLVGQFACTLVLFFIYTSLENPVYYTYRGTTCFNRMAFLETVKKAIYNKEALNFVAIGLKDFDLYRENLSLKNLERLSSNIAEYIRVLYGENAFCIDDDKFLIRINDQLEIASIKKEIEEFFSHPIDLVDTSISAGYHFMSIQNISNELKVDEVESGIRFMLEKANNDVDEIDDFTKAIQQLKRRRTISHIVRKAVKDDLFDVYYQPIRDVSTGKYTSMEALIRLHDAEMGFISPEEFIPIAESDGTILHIGEIVFEKVCKFMHESQCVEKLGVHYVEINLSPLQCFQPDLVPKFSDIMKRYDIRPEWINLEITETASFGENDCMAKNIEELHNMGISFSLDDYGSGFASIDYLFKLPVEIVKIDKSILWQAMKDENAKVVLVCTLQMLKKLGKRIVVEGVEYEEMVTLLAENGCDYMQGYFYSKPLPQAEYIAFLKNHHNI